MKARLDTGAPTRSLDACGCRRLGRECGRTAVEGGIIIGAEGSSSTWPWRDPGDFSK